ncbi:MAG: GNAT family N-acetyltransferase [Thermoplasmatota archaeon]
MAALMTSSREADGVDYVTTEEDLTAQFDNPLDFDPQADILVAEAEGKMIALARVWWEDREDDKRMYAHSVELLLEWRDRGIREELFLYNERHIRGRAKKDGKQGVSFFELWANDSENEWKSIVLANGYRPVQHELDMVRSLDEIPQMPLPAGFEIRPVVPGQYSKIWEANKEAGLQDWDFSENEWDDEHFEAFKKSSSFQPDLWQVAWDGDTLAGMVLNYIAEEENQQFERKRGHTEHVFVREHYRGRGLARALLARSFKILKDKGMREAMLGMEVENPHDPLRLYEGMGFRVVKHFTWYHKPIP